MIHSRDSVPLQIASSSTYPFTDRAYEKLLAQVTGKPISDSLRSDILAFYVDLGAPFATKKDPKAWQNILIELGKLKDSPATRVELQHPQ